MILTFLLVGVEDGLPVRFVDLRLLRRSGVDVVVHGVLFTSL